MRRLDELDPAEVEAVVRRARARRARTSSSAKGSRGDAIEFVRQIDMRYVGQSYELTIPAGDGLLERFHAEHDRTYGFARRRSRSSCVSLRLTSVGRIAKPPLRALEPGGGAEPKERRPVYFAEAGGYVDCPIYDRYALPAGAPFAGPGGRRGVRLDHRRPPRLRASGSTTHGNLIIEKEST